MTLIPLQAGKKAQWSFSSALYTKLSFHQDRLGTNIGNTQTKRPAVLQGMSASTRRGWCTAVVGKRHFLRHLYITTNILPRQARDKHRENSKKSGVFPIGPNKSDRWRRGLTVSYMPASMRVVAPDRPPAGGVGDGNALPLPAADGRQPTAEQYEYLYLLRGEGVAGVNDGSARNFIWNPRPVFRKGVDMVRNRSFLAIYT